MNNLTKHIVDEITRQGADLVGVGNLLELPEKVRCSLPIGISVAVKFPKEIISGIVELPTQEYKNWYDILNNALICRDAAYERSKRGFGGNVPICGKCIVVCPHTQKYIRQR